MTTGIQTNWPPLRLPDHRIQELREEASVAEWNPLMALVASVKLLAAGKHLSQAQKLLRLLASEYPVVESDHHTFFRMLPAAIMAHAPDIAVSWLTQRYKPSFRLVIEPGKSGVGPDVFMMRVRGDEVRFQLSPRLFEFHAGDMILSRWAAMVPLWDSFMRSSSRIDGTVAVNLLDNGSRPGLALCEFRRGYYLIPDSTFMAHDQYAQERIDFRSAEVAWQDRSPIAFWRGSASGVASDPAVGWHSMPRVRLCEIGAEHPDIIDAGITNVAAVHIPDPAARAELESRNLMRPRVPSLYYKQFRYQIDVDGYSNAWDGFYLRLLTGSPVLKVASHFGFEQWYYDRLKPWVNFVPVVSNMTDLVDKVNWLRANDEAARKIGEAGRELAESLDQRELVRTAPVIAAAMRAEAGGPLIDLRFGSGARDNGALQTGWRTPEGDGVRAAATECSLTLPRPPGFGDYVLLAEVSPLMTRPCHITIVANGEPVANKLITERMTVYASLPRTVATANETILLSFHIQAESVDPPEASLMTLHRAGVAAADPMDWTGYPDMTALLEELNSARRSGAHDLGWRNPDVVRLAPPAGWIPRAIRTHFGTILYADRETGRVRHGSASMVPGNLFLVQMDNSALLARAGEDGTYVAVRLRPEGPLASGDDWAPWAGGGFARTFAMSASDVDSMQSFTLRAAGLFVCAEANGEITLSREEAAEWEHFLIGRDDA